MCELLNAEKLTKSIVASMLCIYVFARAKTFFLLNLR